MALTGIGTTVLNAEYLIMLEDFVNNSDNPDTTRDKLGELTLMDDLANGGFRARWNPGNTALYTTNTPVGIPSPSTVWWRVYGTGTEGVGGLQGNMTDPIIGYQINGNTVDMYINWSRIGNPTSLCLMWATDTQNNNLDQTPNCDRAGDIICISNINPNPNANVAITKEVNQTMVDSGDSVTYYYNVTNTGNCNLTNVQVTDNIYGGPLTLQSGDTNGNDWLDISETWRYIYIATITNSITNTGNVSAEDELGNTVYDEATATVYVSSPSPSASPSAQVPALTPVGTVLLVGALSLISVIMIRKKRK